jgi:hypothetical protein
MSHISGLFGRSLASPLAFEAVIPDQGSAAVINNLLMIKIHSHGDFLALRWHAALIADRR